MLAKCLCSKEPRGKRVGKFIIPQNTEVVKDFVYAGIRRCSMQYIEYIARNAKCGIVEALGKGAQLFIYGRDLLKGSFKVLSKPKCRQGFVAVFSNGLFLGIGKLKGNLILNVVDVGLYLRDERSAALRDYIC